MKAIIMTDINIICLHTSNPLGSNARTEITFHQTKSWDRHVNMETVSLGIEGMWMFPSTVCFSS